MLKIQLQVHIYLFLLKNSMHNVVLVSPSTSEIAHMRVSAQIENDRVSTRTNVTFPISL